MPWDPLWLMLQRWKKCLPGITLGNAKNMFHLRQNQQIPPHLIKDQSLLPYHVIGDLLLPISVTCHVNLIIQLFLPQDHMAFSLMIPLLSCICAALTCLKYISMLLKYSWNLQDYSSVFWLWVLHYIYMYFPVTASAGSLGVAYSQFTSGRYMDQANAQERWEETGWKVCGGGREL